MVVFVKDRTEKERGRDGWRDSIRKKDCVAKYLMPVWFSAEAVSK